MASHYSASEPEELDNGDVQCHECGNTYSRIGYHLSNNSCEYPTLPPSKESLLTGLMLGDATLRTHTKHPFLQTYMVSEAFLAWLDRELGWISTGVSQYRTAERSAELSRENGHSADPDDYHDVYVMQTRTLPQLTKFESWYGDDGRKQLPSYLVLTPATAKVWYACDGSLNWDARYPGARPHATLGVGDGESVQRMFEESTFPHVPEVDTNAVRFTVDETEDLLDWMGDAPPGFEYKFQNDSYETYQSEKKAVLG